MECAIERSRSQARAESPKARAPRTANGWHRSRRGQTAHGLVEQNLDIPAQRHQIAPELREAVHRKDGKSDAGEAESRRAEYAGQTEPHRQLPDEKLEQRAQSEIGEQQQTGGRAHQDGVAAERHGEDAVNDAGSHDHHQQEYAEQGHQLADESRERAAAGGREPRSPAARRELRADGISGRNRRDDVKNRGQDGAEQKLRVVQRGIGEDVLLDDQAAGRESRRLRHGFRGKRRSGRGDGAGERTRRAVSGREKLPVIEHDDLGPLAGNQVPLEIRRDIDRRDGVARAYRVHRARQIIGSFGDADARGRGDRLHVGQRRRRAVGVHDADAQTADDRVAERPCEQGEGYQRNADRQEKRQPIAPHPAQLARRDEQEPGTTRRFHYRLPGTVT